MKKYLFTVLILSFILIGCSSGNVEPDYTADEFEEALNDGENLDGKIVEFEVKEFIPDSAFGYNLVSGEHLNFVSSNHPDADVGDELIVEVKEVESLMGSYIIDYYKE